VNRSKWDFYTRENSPSREAETLVANFLRISGLPESIHIGENLTDHPEDIYVDNPRYLPIWVESGLFYSLIPTGEMPDSLRPFVNAESVQSRPFDSWLESEEAAPNIAKRLFNREIRRRAVDGYEGCRTVRHQYESRLLFKREGGESGGEDDSPGKTRVEGWDVAMDWGTYTAHRYATPVVKRYEDQFYVSIDTGWMFSRSGQSTDIIKGDIASKLHDKLQSSGHYRPNNLKAQFRQWRAYLGMDEPAPLDEINIEEDSQRLEFEREEGLKLRVRPPKDGDERELLMQRGVNTY
jgi:hypothetical protein